MDWKSMAYTSAALAACASLAAADTNTLSSMLVMPGDGVSTKKPKNPEIIAEFERHIGNIGPTIMIDRFGRLSRFDWLEKSQSEGYAFVAQWNGAGRNALRDIAASSLRETFVGLPGIDERESVWADLVKGTIGNTAEQRLDLTSPIANASKVTWEEQGQRDGNLSYGLRPFNDRPYVYEGAAIRGRSGKVLCYEDLRIRYVPFDRMRLEGAAIIPLTASWQANVGASADPFCVGGRGSGSSASVGLSRIFNYAETLSGGMSIDETGRLSFAAELTRDF